MDRIDYELKIIDILVEACSKLNSNEFETLLIRVEEAINYYEQ